MMIMIMRRFCFYPLSTAGSRSRRLTRTTTSQCESRSSPLSSRDAMSAGPHVYGTALTRVPGKNGITYCMSVGASWVMNLEMQLSSVSVLCRSCIVTLPERRGDLMTLGRTRAGSSPSNFSRGDMDVNTSLFTLESILLRAAVLLPHALCDTLQYRYQPGR
jgi:hypothetical protein